MLAERPRHRVDLLVEQHEVAGDRRLAVGRRLEVQDGGDAHRRQQGLPHLGDRLRARHRHLEHAAADVAPGAAERLLDLLAVERRSRRRRRPGGAERRGARRQRLAQGRRELDGVAAALVVHVHDVRRHLVEVVVHRRHLEAAGEEPRHHRRHLLIEQHEIAHDHRLVADLLERRVGAEREARLDGDALDRHGQVGARHPDAEDVAGLELPGLAERLLDQLPVGIGGAGHAGDREHEHGDDEKRAHRDTLPAGSTPSASE